MPASCLSLINSRQDTRRYVTHYGSVNQEFADASVRRNEQKGVLIAGALTLSPQTPSLFPFLLIPYQVRHLLGRLIIIIKN